MKYYLSVALIACTCLFSCRKKDDPGVNTNTNGSVAISIDHVAGNQPLVTNTAWYKNEFGDSLQFTVFKYYISNIQLLDAAGNVAYRETESYHYVNEETASSKGFTMANVAPGTYRKIKFLIGVDSLRNVSGAQTGALEPGYGMFWDWNTGYIMAKVEGVSPQSTASGKEFIYHIGGFSGQYNCLRWVTIDLPQDAVVTTGGKPSIHMSADILEWFRAPEKVEMNKTSFCTSPGKTSVMFADNYADMFKVLHVDN